MKKILIGILILLLVPVIVFADEGNNIENYDNENTTTTEKINESPDTGVEDYFLTLGIVSICLGGTLYIINKKNVFKEI